MVPRTEMITTSATTPLRKALALLVQSGYSRVPVIGESVDDLRGVVYLKDVVRRMQDTPSTADDPVLSALRPAVFVPETKPVDDLLREMQASASHIAIVVDEYGGIAGLVTIEDALEEIVGEIQDEYDREAPAVEELGGSARRITARYDVEDLEELYGVELPKEDVETVGGLLAKLLGRVPIPGATVEVCGLVLVAESAKGRRNRIGTVLVRRVGDDPVPDHLHDTDEEPDRA